MSHTAHIPRHRRPRRRASSLALRAGVAGGVLSMAVTGSSGTAGAAGPAAETAGLPALTNALASQGAASADATHQAAGAYASRALRSEAAAKAAEEAEKDLAAAERRAKAEKRAAEEAARREAASRAARSDTRSTLGAFADASPSGSVGTVLAFLRAQVGDAYVMGGTGPNSWDCSGLVQAAFKRAGISLPRTSQAQSTAGTQVPVSSAKPGDVLYWGGAGAAYHVGVYLGDDRYLDAANPSKGVVVQSLSGYPASGAVRLL